MTTAAEDWERQILVATHSPVLISQFPPDQTVAVEAPEGRSRLSRLSEIEGIKDLLEDYASGTLYMSEIVASQSQTAPLEPRGTG